MRKYVLLMLLVFVASMVSTPTFGSSIVSEQTSTFSNAQTQEIIYATERAKLVYNAVSNSSFSYIVQQLSVAGPRPIDSAQNDQTKTWLESKLYNLSQGKIETDVVGSRESILGRLPGTGDGSEPAIVVGAHFDTVANSPGANDDGSGVAATLEIARVLSRYDWPIDIYFGFWNAEEIGLIGAEQVSNYLQSLQIDILVYFNFDMLLVPSLSAPSDLLVNMAYNVGSGSSFHQSRYWAELVRTVNWNLGDPVVKPIRGSDVSHWQQSDHYAFISNGYSSVVYAFQTGDNRDTAWHTPQDTWDNPLYDYNPATETVASVASAIAFALSRTGNQRTHERHSIGLSDGESRDFYIEMSILSDLEIHGGWIEGERVIVKVYGPNGNQLESLIVDNTGSIMTHLFNTSTVQLGMHRVRIVNNGTSDARINLEFRYETDIEGNGVADSTEPWFNSNLVDSDSDGIPDVEELNLGSDPFSVDGDNDTIDDYLELFVYGTDPMNNDSDSDAMPDGWEIQYGLDPLDNDDADYDPDYDGAINVVEYLHGTNFTLPDTDFDNMLDGWEIYLGLDPLRDDSLEDPDGDSMNNLYEYRTGHDPLTFDGPMVLVIQLEIIGSLSLGFLVIAGGVWFRRKRRRMIRIASRELDSA
ncbi:MAG: M28 family peptidase [Candidatus Thorarchaeota archaeon]